MKGKRQLSVPLCRGVSSQATLLLQILQAEDQDKEA
jgi:hypothetical protein